MPMAEALNIELHLREKSDYDGGAVLIWRPNQQSAFYSTERQLQQL